MKPALAGVAQGEATRGCEPYRDGGESSCSHGERQKAPQSDRHDASFTVFFTGARMLLSSKENPESVSIPQKSLTSTGRNKTKEETSLPCVLLTQSAKRLRGRVDVDL